jgi:hypothetical protein
MSKLKLPPRSPAIVPQATLASVPVVVDALQDRPATNEVWPLAARLNSRVVGKRPIDTIREAKRHFAVHCPAYKPSVDQLAATRDVDVGRPRKSAPSFDKLVRSLELVAEASRP